MSETIVETVDLEKHFPIRGGILLRQVAAIHAVDGKTDSKIEMTASVDDFGKIVIKVIDNGTGISPETLERIFIPFFTTKKKGSGIGLSLSRQIMRMHKGTINVSSKIDQGTIFTLRF